MSSTRYTIKQGKFGLYFYDTERQVEIGLEQVKELLNSKAKGLEINELVEMIHKLNVDAGWWDGQEERDMPTKLSLIASEVFEAFEGLRKNLMDDKLPHRKMEEVELADVLIRVFDYAGRRGYDLQGAMFEKLEFNATRADHKPENRAKENGKKF